MKVKNISNPEEFLKVIDSCEGKVELITDDGDRFHYQQFFRQQQKYLKWKLLPMNWKILKR